MHRRDIDEFCELLKAQMLRKEALYDGASPAHGEDRNKWFMVALLIEETGEVASAIIRERPELAKAETIDVAHCAFLIWKYLQDYDGYL